MENHCGLMNPSNPCTCEKQVFGNAPQATGKPIERPFTSYPCRGRHDPDAMSRLQEMDELERVAIVYRSHPDYTAPETFLEKLKDLMFSSQFELLN